MTTPPMPAAAPNPSVAPTVFISSTVLDLADLRSGIRYVLKRSGVNVLVSEASDFPLYGDRSALEECFENIRNSDVFVLIVDKRRGSEYEPGLSVTRQELRVARESFLKTGKPYHLLFIRDGVPEDLAQRENSDLLADGFQDPAHLREFIKEIKQPEEETLPDFLKEFASFDDIMDSINARLNLGSNLVESITRKSVHVELTRNLARMVDRVGQGALEDHFALASVRGEFDFKSLPMTGTTSVSKRQRTRLVMGVLGRVKGSSFELDAIRGAVKGGVFLHYDSSAGGLIETETHRALQQVLDDVESLGSLDSDDWDEKLLQSLASREQNQILVVDLAFAIGFANRAENLFNAMRKAYWLLSGSAYGDFNLPRLPTTPLGPEGDLQIRKERIEHWEVDQLFRQDILPFGIKTPSDVAESTREARLSQAVEQFRAIEASIPELQLDDAQLVALAETFVDWTTANPDEGLTEPSG